MSVWAGLIERLEACQGPDRKLDAVIAKADGWIKSPGSDTWAKDYGGTVGTRWLIGAPNYTDSLDAALTLVPEGNYWLGIEQPRSWRRDDEAGGASAHFKGQFWNASKWSLDGGPSGNPAKWKWFCARIDLLTERDLHRFMGHSDVNPAIALCIASIKARASHGVDEPG